MPENEIVYLCAAPSQGALDQGLVEGVAAFIGKSLLDTRLLLTGKIPRIIMRYEDKEISAKTATKLTTLGLNVITCSESTLGQSSAVSIARSLTFDGGGVSFRDQTGKETRITPIHLFLIIAGRFETSTENIKTTTRNKFSPLATLLTGGIPIWRRVEEKSTSRTVEAGLFTRLYLPEISVAYVEILQQELNYSFLGKEVTNSSIINFRLTLERIRKVFPEAIFDDRLMETGSPIPESQRLWQEQEINCRLIYLFHLKTKGVLPDYI